MTHELVCWVCVHQRAQLALNHTRSGRVGALDTELHLLEETDVLSLLGTEVVGTFHQQPHTVDGDDPHTQQADGPHLQGGAEQVKYAVKV